MQTAYQLAQDIAKHLPGYTATGDREGDTNSHVAYLVPANPAQPKLVIDYEPRYRDPAKAEVGHSRQEWHDKEEGRMHMRSINTGDSVKRINVSVKRGPEAIANDILRRLMPNAEEEHTADREYIEQVKRIKQAKINMVLAAGTVASTRKIYNGHHTVSVPHTDIEIDDGGCFKLKFTTYDPAKAIKVIEFFQTL